MATLAMSVVTSQVTRAQSQIMQPIRMLGLEGYFKDDIRKKDKLIGKTTNLTVQTSTYNEVIPVIFGQVRIAGNIIWATDIKEVVNVVTSSTRIGGKGGQKITQNQLYHSYFATLAIGICEGEIDDMLTIWADEKIVKLSSINYTLYKGTSTQTVDPTIESYEGSGSTPAYRDLAYIVIEDFPLAEYGNRIPNFTFEVIRKTRQSTSNTLENTIESMIMIPGSGEFVYDTQVHSKWPGWLMDDYYVQDGGRQKINENNPNNKADALVSLDQLDNALPNLEWVAPVACWFSDGIDISTATITPRVEFKVTASNNPTLTTPSVWQVGSWTRDTATIPGLDSQGNIRYGGTISDASLIRYLQELQTRGYKIMFYPMIFVDAYQKPWRGRITGNYSDVNNFFTKTNGYNDFILHYANLVKNYVDAFVIGSEMIGLTSITDGNGNFPAVDKFVSLASSVKTIVGSGVKVTYAADWSEYHHTDNGWFNLDPLWASSNIDFIGIDAYFPLTDEKQSGITKQKIKDGWTSGEGYDWYYSDEQRTNKVNLTAEFAWKNIAYWWSNYHENPDENQTSWVPESKKIWFTEYGFPSVDGCSNQPNVFYDPESSESAFPRFSEGKIDFFAQRTALEATEEVWANSSMVEQKFVWTWDARPFPFYPQYTLVWGDCGLWKYGHWVNGKIGLTLASDVIFDLISKAELTSSDIETSEIYDVIDGLVVNERMSIADVIEIIQKVLFLDVIENDGQIQFIPKNNENSETISEDEIIEKIKIQITNENDLPQRIDLAYINKDLNYETGNSSSERMISNSFIKDSIAFPVVLNEFKAKHIADVILYTDWLERTIYEFEIPEKYSYLNPSNIINITYNNIIHEIRIINLVHTNKGTLKIIGVKNDSLLYSKAEDEQTVPTDSTSLNNSSDETQFEIFDLPTISNDDLNKAKLYFSVNGEEDGWKGCAIYCSKDEGTNYEYVTEKIGGSTAGKVLTLLDEANPNYFDYKHELIIKLNDQIYDTLETLNDAELFSGKNIAIVGNEIIQFQTATLNQDGTYTLTGLLRGMFGTESEITNHTLGERFAIFDENLLTKNVEEFEIGMSQDYKAVAFGKDLADITEESKTATAKNLIPLAPVHIKGERDGSENLTITWHRRARGYQGWRDYVDAPLIEKTEEYEIEILNGSNEVLRTIEGLTTKTYTYTATDQTTDFGSTQSSVKVRIYQMSDVVGRGTAGEESV